VLGAAVGLWLFAQASPPAAKPPEDCGALYDGDSRRRDLGKALACYRSQEDWAMVAIMQLNGEAGPVDLAGARASFQRLIGPGGFKDGDALALEAIVEKREASPAHKGPRVDFCKDVAAITPSLAYCERRNLDRRAAQDDLLLARLRARLEPRARPAFDGAVGAFRDFIAVEGERVYQEYIDGTIRNQASLAAEAFARASFMAEMKWLADEAAPTPNPGARSFGDADRELNAVYQAGLSGYATTFDGVAKTGADPATAETYRTYVRDYRTKSHAAQHAWVRYRDAIAKLAMARWPAAHEAEALTRARITEDRIRELRPGEGELR